MTKGMYVRFAIRESDKIFFYSDIWYLIFIPCRPLVVFMTFLTIYIKIFKKKILWLRMSLDNLSQIKICIYSHALLIRVLKIEYLKTGCYSRFWVLLLSFINVIMNENVQIFIILNKIKVMLVIMSKLILSDSFRI